MRLAVILMASALFPLCGQENEAVPSLDALTPRAAESVTVNLDSSTLQVAAAFLSDAEKGQRAAKKLLSGLKRVYVRSLQFDNEGTYTAADVEALRGQFPSPGWTRAVGITSQRYEQVDVYLRALPDGLLGGVAVIATEPRELTFVRLDGTLDLAQPGQLDGELGIPRLALTGWGRRGNRSHGEDSDDR